jgi:hypothetical protein
VKAFLVWATVPYEAEDIVTIQLDQSKAIDYANKVFKDKDYGYSTVLVREVTLPIEGDRYNEFIHNEQGLLCHYLHREW